MLKRTQSGDKPIGTSLPAPPPAACADRGLLLPAAAHVWAPHMPGLRQKPGSLLPRLPAHPGGAAAAAAAPARQGTNECRGRCKDAWLAGGSESSVADQECTPLLPSHLCPPAACQVDIVLHGETNRRSTALPAVLLAPADVTLVGAQLAACLGQR